ncbi:MAG: NUDIX domain-containing protein [Gemmatimonadetes bacterium]|nr:NUDIX domain-containing protein [Gemmatimonadota bacterium]
MTEITCGVVDVHVVDPAAGFKVLMLRRAAGVRCTGAWEGVHGSIEPGESPEDAAAREFAEETGLPLLRLYSIGTNPFYVPSRRTVQVAVVFAALTDSRLSPRLAEEHDAFEWMGLAEALERATWPRTHQALRDVHHLLRTGDAGPAEDVLRVR